MSTKGQGCQAGFANRDAQFLIKLPNYSVFGRFTFLNLAARKFPKTRHGFTRGALCNQNALLLIDECAGGNDEERRHGSRSAPIVGIDRDVLGGEVAGPDCGMAFSEPEIDADTKIGTLHVGRDRIF